MQTVLIPTVSTPVQCGELGHCRLLKLFCNTRKIALLWAPPALPGIAIVRSFAGVAAAALGWEHLRTSLRPALGIPMLRALARAEVRRHDPLDRLLALVAEGAAAVLAAAVVVLPHARVPRSADWTPDVEPALDVGPPPRLARESVEECSLVPVERPEASQLLVRVVALLDLDALNLSRVEGRAVAVLEVLVGRRRGDRLAALVAEMRSAVSASHVVTSFRPGDLDLALRAFHAILGDRAQRHELLHYRAHVRRSVSTS